MNGWAFFGQMVAITLSVGAFVAATIFFVAVCETYFRIRDLHRQLPKDQRSIDNEECDK